MSANGIYEDVELLKEQMAQVQSDISSLTLDVQLMAPSQMEEGGNLNDLTEGLYYIPTVAIAATLQNSPVTGSTGIIQVFTAGTDGQIIQRFTPCKKDQITTYERAFYSNSWGTWQEVGQVDSGWKVLPLASGVSAYSDAQKPMYRKIGKTVYMTGVFKGIAGNDIVIATLPEGYRPAKKAIFAFGSIGQRINRMEVLQDGTVRHNRSTVEPTIAENWHSVACSFTVQ